MNFCQINLQQLDKFCQTNSAAGGLATARQIHLDEFLPDKFCSGRSSSKQTNSAADGLVAARQILLDKFCSDELPASRQILQRSNFQQPNSAAAGQILLDEFLPYKSSSRRSSSSQTNLLAQFCQDRFCSDELPASRQILQQADLQRPDKFCWLNLLQFDKICQLLRTRRCCS